MTSHPLTKASPCCGRKIDAATGIGHDHRPRPGDLSICIYCMAWLTFDRHGNPRRMTQAEIDGLDETDREVLRRADAAIWQAVAEAGGVGHG